MDWVEPRTESVLDVAAANIMESVGDAKPLPMAGRVALVIGFLGVVAALDYSTGTQLSFSVFYLIPVLITGALISRRTARVVALITMLTWGVVDFASGVTHSPVVLAWNSLVRIVFLILVSEQFCALISAHARERRSARTDRLTGIANARVFFERVDQALAVSRRDSKPFTIAYLDLDGFKAVNDGYGHAEGDQVLRAAAMTISGCLRATDLAARLGGDEFGIVLSETDADGAMKTAERVVKELRHAMGGRWDVGVTMGVVTFVSAPDCPEDAVKLADELMYRGKVEGGRGCIEQTIWPAADAA